MLVLFSTLFSDYEPLNKQLDSKMLYAVLNENNINESENNWEGFFWVIIIMAIFTRHIKFIFKWLWIPFKIAFVYY